jgi:hypothetical protein
VPSRSWDCSLALEEDSLWDALSEGLDSALEEELAGVGVS